MADPSDPQIAEAEVLDLLVSRLKDDSTVWTELADAFNNVIKTNVDGPIQQLEEIRFLPPTADKQTLSDACRLLGFDLSQDILNLSIDKFTKIATQLGMYPDSNGTEAFVKFISLMINGFCNVDYLWTKDYINFYPQPGGVPIELGGPWFKTTHVDLTMGFLTLAGLQLKQGQTLYQRTKEIFYQQAPVALVIERMGFSAYDQVDFGFAVKALPAQRVYDLLAAGNAIGK
jgi:hypothetical protein